MSHNTVAANRHRHNFANVESVWLFGYGSLIYKVDFPYLEKRPAAIYGWLRRFWQGSHDHRGTPTAPGRVLTLVAQAGARCSGMAYRVSPEVFAQLDEREKNGYLREDITLHFDDGQQQPGLVYFANADNDAYLGPASERDIAAHIAASSGPSGSNRDYLLQLAEALRAMQVFDEHVFLIEQHLLRLINKPTNGKAGQSSSAC
ncbi:gamma-glutamylcyclotransferase [Idiomarina xiamenensis]|uniref:glutathione-specific gamma-glutamylcyclotransferase n=1 Tax=Idiomarina xiamenensis 10-D-4 TaxID=740709 RepID=K2KLK7_9GAMM|nr:gamma-glutamylcyclotransferase [Idiomarina xiamenensis]EKE83409.1 ChaC family protein [Idiomarina xiamenensis 10-D-4]